MHKGLFIVSLPSGGTWPYTEIGYLRRLEGDEWEMHGARIIKRYGKNQALADLAANGPASDTILLPASRKPLPVHRLHMGRPEVCDEKAWAAHVPKPQGWDEQ